jgi:putative oxidoreductase
MSRPLLQALGRLLMSLLFVISGFGKATAAGGTIHYMASMGLPAPVLAYSISVLCELGGGLAILFGFQIRAVSVVMAVFCFATALIAHTNFANPEQAYNFWKNVAMAGGFLQFAAWGAGSWSLDSWLASRRVARPA